MSRNAAYRTTTEMNGESESNMNRTLFAVVAERGAKTVIGVRRNDPVHVGVLEEEQVVVAGLAVQRALEIARLPVRHPAELTHPQRVQSNSASQSRVSRSVRMALRKAAAYAPSKAR